MLLTLNSTLSNSRVTISASSPFRLLPQVRKLVWRQEKWCGCPSLSVCPACIVSLYGGRTASHRGPCFSSGPPKRNVSISPRWELFRPLSLIFSSFLSTGGSLVNKKQTLGLKASHSSGDIQREKSHWRIARVTIDAASALCGWML